MSNRGLLALRISSITSTSLFLTLLTYSIVALIRISPEQREIILRTVIESPLTNPIVRIAIPLLLSIAATLFSFSRLLSPVPLLLSLGLIVDYALWSFWWTKTWLVGGLAGPWLALPHFLANSETVRPGVIVGRITAGADNYAEDPLQFLWAFLINSQLWLLLIAVVVSWVGLYLVQDFVRRSGGHASGKSSALSRIGVIPRRN
jgi:hypothetical protein